MRDGANWPVSLEGYRSGRGVPWERPVRRKVREGIDSWSASLSPEAFSAFSIGPFVTRSDVPRALVACLAELVRRYAGDSTVAVLALGGGREIVPLIVQADAEHTLWDATIAVQAAEERVAKELPTTFAALRRRAPASLTDHLFPLRVACGVRAPRLPAQAKVLVSLVRRAGAGEIVVTADRRWIASRELALFGRRLVHLIEQSMASDAAPLDHISLVTDVERQALEASPAGVQISYDRDVSISALLRTVAQSCVSAVALDDGTRRVTYGELIHRVSRARDALMGAGIRRGRIGVLMDRSIEQVVTLAAVLETGSAYVPMDAAHPPLRLRRMVELAEIRAIVTTPERRAQAESWFADLTPRPTIFVLPTRDEGAQEENAAPVPPEGLEGGERPAYVIFTSGSTGEPKGVEVPHRAVMRLVRGTTLMDLGPRERVLHNAPLTFDVSVFELWGALLNGATLVLAPTGLLSLEALGQFIAEQKVTAFATVAALFLELVEFQIERLAGVRQLMVGGDALPVRQALKLLRRYPSVRLINGYGPTENTTVTTFHVVRGNESADVPIPIGIPVENSSTFILDRHLRHVGTGLVGELCTGGDGLAIGYVGRPDLTSERFVSLELMDGRAVRVYRTGDLARFRADGEIEFLGRADGQVKLRGYRIELEEIETVLGTAPGIAGSAVALTGSGAGQRLRAVVVLQDGIAEHPVDGIRGYAASRLPPYMVPSEFIVLPQIPTTANGKVDRRAIAALDAQIDEAARVQVVPEPQSTSQTLAAVLPNASIASVEATLMTLWSQILDSVAFDRHAAFFDVGGNSLLAMRLVEEVRQVLHVDLPVVRVFEFPTVAGLARFLVHGVEATSRRIASSTSRPLRGGDPVAIIGMAGRFPGAASVHELWALLRDEREGVRRFAMDELDPSIRDRDDPAYVSARGVLDDTEGFDPEFFGMSPRIAEITDPQQRLLLELAWQAFEDAGVVPGDVEGHTGVFAGVSHNGYLEKNLQSHPELEERVGALAIVFSNDKDYAAAHIAHRLDLRGPAVAVQTSSSTSLTAIAMAVQAIRSGQCDMALAGGASVTIPVNSGHRYEDGAIFSRDGHTRTFDAAASGAVFSDGAAMVLLQRLEDAERDGRRVDAVIYGVGMTNDGAARASFSAPSVRGQEACITRAFADAGWSPESVGYVEAHGTATPLGDPIEVEALTRAFAAGTDRKRFCWLGSLKSNIGHLTAAAGAAGVIKVALSMRHKWIPASINFDTPNPRIAFDHSPFLVPRRGLAWETDGGPRRAGVSSFGVGGTNIHLLLEEPPMGADSTASASAPDRARLYLLSARTSAALRARAGDLATALADESLSLDAVASTLRGGRQTFERRTAIVATTREELRQRLHEFARESNDVNASGAVPKVVFLFSGQGTQTAGAAAELYNFQPEFRAAIDRVSAAVGPVRGRPLTEWLFADDARVPGIADLLRSTDIAQPVLFALQYALGQTLIAAGVQPAAMMGHSIGEYVAACLAGVMSLCDAARIVVERGRLMASMPPGAMLAVRAPAADVQPLLVDGVTVAAINAPRLCVVSGPEHGIAGAEIMFKDAGIECSRLQTSHAFHSASMDDAARELEVLLRTIELHPPQLPFASCVSGELISAAEATDAAYWARQLREPVRFADGLLAAAGGESVLVVEAGPRETLCALARQVLPGRVTAVAALPLREGVGDVHGYLAAVGALWIAGVGPLNWMAVDHVSAAVPVSLPGYPFDRRRCWVDAAGPGPRPTVADSHSRGFEVLLQSQSDLIDAQRDLLLRTSQLSTQLGVSTPT